MPRNFTLANSLGSTKSQKARAANTPYNPGIEFKGGDYIAAAGRNVGDDIAKALRRYDEEKKKKAFNEGAFDYMSTQSDANGKPLVTPEILQKWHNMNPDAQAGALSLMGGTLEQAKKEKLAKMQIDAANQRREEGWPDPETLQRLESQGFIYTPTSPRSGQFVNTRPKKADEDNWKKLDADTKAVSGAGLGDWNRAKNHKIENGQFVAELEAVEPPKGVDPAVAAFLSKPAKKLSVPVSEYQTLHRRYKALSESFGAPADGATLPDPGAATDLDGITGQAPLPNTAAPAVPVKVNTPEEAAALPSGTLFVTPDGRVKRRP